MSTLKYCGEDPEVLAETDGLYAVWQHVENGSWRVLRLSGMPNYPPEWACVAIANSRFDAVEIALTSYSKEQ